MTPGEDRIESHLGQGWAQEEEEEEDGHCHQPLGGHCGRVGEGKGDSVVSSGDYFAVD